MKKLVFQNKIFIIHLLKLFISCFLYKKRIFSFFNNQLNRLIFKPKANIILNKY